MLFKKDGKVFERITFKMKDAKSDHEDGEEVGHFSGLLSTFGNVDRGDDRVLRGAFKKTLKEKKAFHLLLDHDPTQPAGMFKAKENNEGLFIDATVPLIDPKVRQRFALIKLAIEMDTPMGLSIGFRTMQSKFVDEELEGGGVRTIRDLIELMLIEGSSVIFPMNEMATSHDAKMSWVLDLIKNGKYSIDELKKALVSLPGDEAATHPDDPAISQSTIEQFGKLFI